MGNALSGDQTVSRRLSRRLPGLPLLAFTRRSALACSFSSLADFFHPLLASRTFCSAFRQLRFGPSLERAIGAAPLLFPPGEARQYWLFLRFVGCVSRAAYSSLPLFPLRGTGSGPSLLAQLPTPLC